MRDALGVRPAARDWIASIVLAVGTLAVVAFTPGYDDLIAPVSIDGKVGSTVTGSTWSIEIDGVRAATRIATDLETRETDGAFIVVDATVRATDETTYAPSISARDRDGTIWRMTERVSSTSTLHGTELSPGIGASGSYVIEVPADADVDHLLVARDGSAALDEQFEFDVDPPDVLEVIELEPPRRIT